MPSHDNEKAVASPLPNGVYELDDYEEEIVPRSGEPSGSQSMSSKMKSFFKRDKKKDILLTPEEIRILKAVKARAKMLDTALDMGCFKVGLDPIIGLVPVIGDFATTLMGLNLIYTAKQADIPKELVSKMLWNVAMDFGFGLVPVLGDVFDFAFKCNRRNARLFEAFLYQRAAERQKGNGDASNLHAHPKSPPPAHTNGSKGHQHFKKSEIQTLPV